MTSPPFVSFRSLALAVIAGLALAVTGLSPAMAAPTRPTPTPAIPTSFPVGIEEMSPYVAQASCEWTDKPGTIALGALLAATYPGTSYGVSRPCNGTTSEHYDGRALDWMNTIRKPAEAAQATALLNWLFATDSAGNTFANVRRLGVMYVIWNGRIWGSYRPGWMPYRTCSVHPETSWDTTCHRDHMHFSLSWAGAMKRTSFWTGSVAADDYGPCRPADLRYAAPYAGPNPTECPSYPDLTAATGSTAAYAGLVTFSGAQLRAGYTGDPVAALQTALGVTPANGSFGPLTITAVLAFKAAHGLPATSLVDASTWRALLTAFKPITVKPTTVKPTTVKPTTVKPSPVKPTTVKPSPVKPTTVKPSTVKPVIVKPAGAKPVVNPLSRYRSVVLRVGSKGAAVTALQRRLKLATVTGTFAAQTLAAVKAFQRAHHLPATGLVTRVTWLALGA